MRMSMGVSITHFWLLWATKNIHAVHQMEEQLDPKLSSSCFREAQACKGGGEPCSVRRLRFLLALFLKLPQFFLFFLELLLLVLKSSDVAISPEN